MQFQQGESGEKPKETTPEMEFALSRLADSPLSALPGPWQRLATPCQRNFSLQASIDLQAHLDAGKPLETFRCRF